MIQMWRFWVGSHVTGAVAQPMQYVESQRFGMLCVDHDEDIKSNHRVRKLNLDTRCVLCVRVRVSLTDSSHALQHIYEIMSKGMPIYVPDYPAKMREISFKLGMGCYYLRLECDWWTHFLAINLQTSNVCCEVTKDFLIDQFNGGIGASCSPDWLIFQDVQ